MLGNHRFPIGSAQNSIHLARIAFAYVGVAKHEWVTQHFVQWNAFMGEQWVPCGNSHHQWIAPRRFSNDAVSNLIGQSEPYVVQVVM